MLRSVWTAAWCRHGPSSWPTTLVNKPYGVVTSAKDDQGRVTVIRLLDVPNESTRRETGRGQRGSRPLTNDGDLAHRLTHPRYAIPKVYEVLVQGEVDPTHITQLLRGVDSMMA